MPSVRACESLADQTPTIPSGADSKKVGLDPTPLQMESLIYTDLTLQRYRLRSRYIEIYIGCAITYPEKVKLLAIGGIARKSGPG